jgi:mono/diheme cytochrome c family protein
MSLNHAMQWTKHTGLIAVLAMLLSACGGLAGEPEIVATMPVQRDTIEEVTPPQSAPDIADGQRIYEQNCASCHGAEGNGQGELVQSGEVPRMPSFLDDAHMRDQSPADYFDIITNGNLENLMPPWEEALTQQERWNVAMYVQTLHYEPEQIERGAELLPDASSEFVTASDASLIAEIEQANPQLDPDQVRDAVAYRRIQSVQNFAAARGITTDEPAIESATFTGSITNGTAGESVPEDLEVVLRFGNFDEGLQSREPDSFREGTYTFNDVPVDSTYEYVVFTIYENRPFVSDFVTGSSIEQTMTLPITIYAVTDNPGVVQLDEIDLRVEELNVEGLGTGLVFTQTNTYTNTSDRVFSILPPGQNQPVSLLVQIPPGSVVIGGNNPRYLVSQEQYTIVDTEPVEPGEHIIDVVYFVPYETSAVIDLPVSRDFQGTLTLELLPQQLTVISDVLQQEDATVVEEGDTEQVITRYTGAYDLAANESVVFEIQGTLFGSENSSESGEVITGDVLLPLVMLVSITLIVIAGVLFWMQSREPDLDDQINEIHQELQRLETMHDAGRINHDVYQRQRKTLQQRLDSLLAQSEGDEEHVE